MMEKDFRHGSNTTDDLKNINRAYSTFFKAIYETFSYTVT